MSRNFELMRRAGQGIGRHKSDDVAVRPEENSRIQLGTDAPLFDQDNSSNWLRVLGILQKHWKLSALFACIIIVTTVVVTVLTKPVYEATVRVEVDPSGEKFSLENAIRCSCWLR